MTHCQPNNMVSHVEKGENYRIRGEEMALDRKPTNTSWQKHTVNQDCMGATHHGIHIPFQKWCYGYVCWLHISSCDLKGYKDRGCILAPGPWLLWRKVGTVPSTEGSIPYGKQETEQHVKRKEWSRVRYATEWLGSEPGSQQP